ncbi:MAG TPA: LCP family protein [Actinomycetes bacterium]|nr:LCP family protein [Actinomycetes bacterium]
MSGPKDWPDGWSRDGGRSVGGGRRSAGDSDATEILPPAGTIRPARATAAGSARGTTTRAPEAPPRRSGPPPVQRSARGGGSRRWLRTTLLVLAGLVVLLLVLFLYFYSRIDKVEAITDYEGRPEPASGTNWLIVGSDSREGLSDQEIKDLRLGKVEGRRTDTIILLHKPASGKPTLVSLPRDSYVPIPGQGRNKLNAAYALGGPQLLVQTVETVTGVRIDHYAEVGFGGFVGMTDAVGGVELCPERRIKDRKSGLNVQKGCQEMDGPTALAYVRARYFDPKGDLGRVERQQEFLGAVFDEATGPAVLLNPFRWVALGNASTTALTIDEGDGPLSLLQFAMTMRKVAGGDGRRITVPVADPNYTTPVGSSVRWDRERALELFRSLDAN